MRVEIITPEKICFSGEADAVYAPGADGVLGILPDHMPLFALLSFGEIKLITGNSEIFFAVGTGCLKTDGKKTTLLVSSAKHEEELYEQEILKAREEAEKIMNEKLSLEAVQAAGLTFKRSLAELSLLRRRKSASTSKTYG